MPIILVGESIADLERQIEHLKRAGFGAAPQVPPIPLTAQEELERKIGKLKQRLTRTTGKVWDIVVAAANLPEGQQFSLEDVATAMGEPHNRVRAWQRILGRTLKKLDLRVFSHVPGTAYPTKFEMPTDIRQAVLAA